MRNTLIINVVIAPLIFGCANTADNRQSGPLFKEDQVTRPRSAVDVLDGLTGCFKHTIARANLKPKKILLLLGHLKASPPANSEAMVWFRDTILDVAGEHFMVSTSESHQIARYKSDLLTESVSPQKLESSTVRLISERHKADRIVSVQGFANVDSTTRNRSGGSAGNLEYEADSKNSDEKQSAVVVEYVRGNAILYDWLLTYLTVSEFNLDTGADYVNSGIEIFAQRNAGGKNSGVTLGFRDAFSFTFGTANEQEYAEPMVAGTQRSSMRFAALDFLAGQFPDQPLFQCYLEHTPADRGLQTEMAATVDEADVNSKAVLAFLRQRLLLTQGVVSNADVLDAIQQIEWLLDMPPTLRLMGYAYERQRLEALATLFDFQARRYRVVRSAEIAIDNEYQSFSLDASLRQFKQPLIRVSLRDGKGAVLSQHDYAADRSNNVHTFSWAQVPAVSDVLVQIYDGPVLITSRDFSLIDIRG